MPPTPDILIAGAGPVALAFAAALQGQGLRITLADPQPEPTLANPPDDGREIALTDASVHVLQSLDAWQHIPPEAIAPLRRMQVLNGPGTYAMHLGTPGQPVGRFAPNHWLRRALHHVARPHVTLLPGTRVTAFRTTPTHIEATLSDGQTLTPRLLVAADTRRSRLRTLAGIPATEHDYRQHMLVCPVEHPRPHDQVATAWFEYGQTLVTLPLNGNNSSAILTLPHPEATRLLALPDPAFSQELTRRYRNRLGPMRPTGPRHAIPVHTAYAHRFTARRFALLGDAAVGMHPTTAHGFNFGLLGAQALARELRTALAAGHDIADPTALLRYQTAHRTETRLFFTAAEALMRLYAAGDSPPARLLRNAALRLGNLPPIRQALAARMHDPT